MLPIKRRRDRQKEKKAQQRTGVSISIPTSTPRLGGPQPPALPRIMFRNRATTSSDETNAGASTDITTERHKVRIVSEVQKPRSNKERNNNNNGMNRSPSGNHQHGSESNATRLSDDIVLEHAHQPDTTDTAITDNTITDNTTPTLTADSTNTDVIMLDDDDDDDDDGVTDANARPITTTEFDDRAYSIPKHYRWPKMQLTNFAMGQAIPKITSNSHLLPWQIQNRHSVPVNTSFSMLREVTSERSDHSLSVFPLLSNIWYQHTIMDRPLHDQLAAQLQDVVYQVWQHFITPKEEHNSSEHTTSQVNELPRELPGPLVDAAVIDMIETFRKLLLCMIQLKQQTGFTQKSGGFDNWRAVCAAAHSINMPSK
ncbi:hypothetical protein BDF22DRAFT_202829 [Syncephalis plumigaleata]|nr:hypothetical protein BDF22DRAFT_202829 [Syncephalis plumigaleata]